MSPLGWLGVGFTLIDLGGWLLWWSISRGRRRTRRVHVRSDPPPRMTRYDEHLLRTEQTELIMKVNR